MNSRLCISELYWYCLHLYVSYIRFVIFFPGQATVGNLAQQVYELKMLTEEKRGASGVSSGPGQSAELAIKLEGLEVPAKILRNFQSGVKRKVIKNPTIQCTGQNKKVNVLTFCIAPRPIVDGSTGAKMILQDIMPIEQATSCLSKFMPKIGVSPTCFV